MRPPFGVGPSAERRIARTRETEPEHQDVKPGIETGAPVAL